MSLPVVLLVEDEPAHAELIERAFGASEGTFRLAIAGTVAEALVKLRTERPALIITDWMLPDGKGLELVAADPDVPVVLMTSYGNERIAVDAIKAGALDYVVKSDATFADMPHTANRACREWDLRLQRQRMESQLQRRVAELEAVNRISTSLRQTSRINEMLVLLLEQTLAALNAADGMVWLLSDDRNQGGLRISRGWLEAIKSEASASEDVIASLVLSSGDTYRCRDFAHDENAAESPYARLGAGYSGVCVPLLTSDEIVGMLLVSLPLPSELSEEDTHLLSTLSEIAGNAIHRMRLHEQTERSLQRLNALHTIDMAITSSIDINLSLNVILDQVLSQLGLDAAAILQVNRHTQTLEYRAGRGFPNNSALPARLRIGEGHAGRTALERTRVHVPLLPAGDQPSAARPQRSEGFTGYCAVPLIAKGNVKGVLEVYRRTILQPGSDWFSYLEALANQAALAIDNWELFERLQRSNTELTLAYDATIEGWSRALDLRDHETEGHTQRVAETTVQLARLLQINDSDLIHLRRGALLHDIGKMGVPDSILLKPGPLTAEEWEIMRQHPVYAYQMLSPIAYLNQALDIPYAHHEHWDGSGYPRGLSGEQIPLAARIFAVVDVWDALRSDRPYRSAWPEARVREYLQTGAGAHFDPQVVSAFLRIDHR